MALETMSPSKHNRMLTVNRPSSNADDFPLPAAKRVKRESDDERNDTTQTESTRYKPVEADPIPPSSQTDLETALPPVKTDQEAIEEYEAYKASEAADLSAEERLEKGSWVKGRSSIYVDAFNLALDQVLEDESHLFNAPERELFRLWRALAYESQYLYVRLFLRKTSAWHRIGRLGYHSDIGDLEAAIQDLQQERTLPPADEVEEESYAGERDRPAAMTLGETFSFAECSDDHISTLDEASGLLLLDELKSVAKEAKVQGKNKKDLLTALRNSSGKQSGLNFGLKRSDTEETTPDLETESDSGRATPARTNRDAHFTRKILEQTGKCIRLSAAPLRLFERVHLVFYRSTEWTEKSLTTIILAKISRRNFPAYIVCRTATIFSTRSLLLEFEASLRTQFQIDNLLEFSGTPVRESFEHVRTIAEEIYPRWAVLVALEQHKEDTLYEQAEGAYLRRFSPGWVYTRIVHKGLLPLARFKEHAREHEILTALLAQRLFHPARRGAWYARKALLEEHYMAALSPAQSRSPEAQQKHWKRIALATCEAGLQDRECHVIYHRDLQKRISKLERQLRVPVREQHDFSHTRLVQPVDHTVCGTRVERPPSAQNTSTISSARGAKTIWLDTHAGNPDTEVSVEEMCLSSYRAAGWKGFHSEGGIIRTLFALLMYDVLFTYIPNVFQTAFQTAPLDLFSDTFYSARLGEINARLAEIANGGGREIVRRVWEEQGKVGTSVVGLRWEYERADLEEIVACFGGEQLATLLRLMAQEYQVRGGGVPDLFLWRVEGAAEGQGWDRKGDGRGGVEAGEEGRESGEVDGDQKQSGAVIGEQNERERVRGGQDKSEDAKANQSKSGHADRNHTESGDANRAQTPSIDLKPSQPPFSDPTTPQTTPQPPSRCADPEIKGSVLFAEVKSANDRLSDTQRMWIHVLTGAGVRVEVCRAVAERVVIRDGE